MAHRHKSTNVRITIGVPEEIARAIRLCAASAVKSTGDVVSEAIVQRFDHFVGMALREIRREKKGK